MGASASAMPKPIETIFHGEPLLAAGLADAFDTYFSKDAKVEFLGQWAPKTADGKAVIITSKELKEVFDCLIKGFSDFTFNKKKAQFVFDEQEKCWKATIIVTGTHDGPYTFAPGEIDALEPTKKKCVVGPEIFRIFIDEKTEKIKKFTVEPLADKPSGPPGFYVLAGGKLPQPTTAA